jgi:acetoin utilization protein AcuC
MGLLSGPNSAEVKFQSAGREILASLHTSRYLDALQNSAAGQWDIHALHMGIGGPDTPVFKGMYEYGALACGASVRGAEMLLGGEAEVAFNPAGGLHHAGPEHAAGFCYINDVAIACKYLADKGRKVLYLDIDVHHGDGVQNAFYENNHVLTISMHETGRILFPGTGFENEIGAGDGRGYAVNIPLPPGTYDDAYLTCFNEIVVPLVQVFKPDVFVLELGADALAGDPLAHLKLTNAVYSTILEFLLECEKPLLVTGGGGYHVENTVRAWSLAWSVMTGEHHDNQAMSFGLGGVMLESTDWRGGFQDRELPVSDQQRRSVEPAIAITMKKIKDTVFPIHGLNPL